MRKIASFTVAMMILAAMVPVSLAQQDDIRPYDGWAGADSPLYGIKLFIQQLEESLAGNSTQKLQKQMVHAEERLSEAQAMANANNFAAMEAAINGYADKLGEINGTMNLPDIDEGQYYSVGPWLVMHRNRFAYMVNNTTYTPESRNCWNNAFQYNMKIQNGRPYTYYNGTAYFVPPGQMKNTGNNSFVPPGLQNKGYVKPAPSAGNGTTAMPGDQQGAQTPYEHNYSYNYSYDYGQNNTNSYDHNYSYSETDLSPGPHQESHGKK
jgi:hypothetical protein